MAASNRCSVCRKEMGAIICPGCNAYFCMKDLRGHREKLSAELDGIIGERDGLQEKINKTTQHSNSSSPLIGRIDDWEKDMIKRVRQVAEQARQHVIELLDSKRTQLASEFRTFSQELIHLKDTENFIENDLTRLKQMVQQFDQDLQRLSQPQTIEVHTEQSNQLDWGRLIYVEEKSDNSRNQQRRQDVIETQMPVAAPTTSNLDENTSVH